MSVTRISSHTPGCEEKPCSTFPPSVAETVIPICRSSNYMDSRWFLLGYGLLFTGVTIGAIYQGEVPIAAITASQAVFGLGGFWWNTTHERSISWRKPREGALFMAKVVVALVGAFAVTIPVMTVLPFGDYSPRTLGRVILGGVFYATWGLLLFKLVFGEYIPRKALKNGGM